jgi:hypothetical protein
MRQRNQRLQDCLLTGNQDRLCLPTRRPQNGAAADAIVLAYYIHYAELVTIHSARQEYRPSFAIEPPGSRISRMRKFSNVVWGRRSTSATLSAFFSARSSSTAIRQSYKSTLSVAPRSLTRCTRIYIWLCSLLFPCLCSSFFK